MAGPDNAWEGPFWLVFQRSSNPIGLLDADGRYVEVNTAATELFGKSRSEIVGTSVLEHIPPAERPRWESEWETFLRTGQYMGTGPVLRADGSQVEVETAAAHTEVGGRRLAVIVLTSPWPVGGDTGVAPADPVLTPREREIVSEIALGHDSPQIAAELTISPETVRTHVRNAMAKLGAHTRAQLVAIALSSGECCYPPHVTGE